MGGEITYKHIQSLKYKVIVTIFRDCNGCKLMGAGGGDSTSDCGTFSLILATSPNSSCGRVDLEKISLSRVSIKEILTVCNGFTTKCAKGGTLPYGVEAHVFEGEADFSNYTSYKGCSFDFYTNISWRTNEISTINSDQTFYNYARINPWETNSSPILTNTSQPILFCQQPLYYNLSALDPDGDSLSYELVSALADYNKSVSYKSGFSGKKPLNVYCVGDCTPDQTSNPPQGIFLNPTNGDLVFTPVKCGQNAVLVLQVTKWRKIKGTYEIMGIVRRDLQYIVNNFGQNNSPVISISNSKMTACEGEELQFEIDVKDIPYQFLDSTFATHDSLKITWSENISDAKFSVVPRFNDSNFKAKFSWTPKLGEAKQLPYRFTVFANDGNCPLNAITSRSFEIYVKPAPKAKINIVKKDCGWITLENVLKQNDIKEHVWTVIKYSENTYNETSKDERPMFRLNGIGKYYISLRVTNSLNCFREFIDSITLNYSDFKAFEISVLGKTAICEGDTLMLSSGINNGYELSSFAWKKDGTIISDKNELKVKSDLIVHSGLFTLFVGGIKEGLNCIDSILINVLINPKPKLSGITDPEFCQLSDGLNKMFQIEPTGGIWTSNNADVISESDMIDQSKLIRNINQILCFKYSFEDNVTGCTSAINRCLTAKAMPELVAKDAVVCKGAGVFWLDNIIEKPGALAARNISWNVESTGVLPLYDPGVGRFNLNTSLLSNGVYKIFMTNSLSNGCILRDSAYLTIMDEVEISFDTSVIFCGGTELNLNELLKVNPKGGGWYCSNEPQWILNNQLSSKACGKIDLSYTYDNFSCYDKKSANFFVDCIPEITFITKFDTICENYDPIILKAEPTDGVWVGLGVSGKQFNPKGLKGQFDLNYEIKSSACFKSKSFTVTVIDSPFTGFNYLVDQICEGDKIDLSGLVSKSHNGYVSFGSGSIETDSALNKIIFYKPSASEIMNRGVILKANVPAEHLCYEFNREYRIKIHQKPKFEFESPLVGCKPFRAYFSHNADPSNGRISSYRWNFGDSLSGLLNVSGMSHPKHLYEIEGNFSPELSIGTIEGCTFFYEFPKIVKVHPIPSALFETMPDEFVSMKNPTFHFINKSIGAKSYYWDFGSNLSSGVSREVAPIFTYPGDTGNFMVTLSATNEFNCSDKFSKWLTIGSDLTIHIPNAFSPDKKGPFANNSYKIIGSNISKFQITVVNRWGEIVYSSRDINEEWDGTANGEICLPGIYVYQINVVSKTGIEYKYGGVINLLR
jgi:gliding motility-associated-like protein